MKKSILTLLLLLAVSIGSWAIRPMPKAFPHKQSDGTTIMAYLHGDGFEAYYTSLDGKVLMRTPGGHDLCYALMQDGKLVASKLIAHEAEARTADELSFLSTNPIDANSKEVRQLAVDKEKMARLLKTPARAAGQASTADGLGMYGTRSGGDVPSIGAITIPVIMVQFPDKKFQPTTTPALMSRVYNERGYTDRMGSVGSIKDYFISQSDSMFIPTFDIVDTVTLDRSYAYYGANGSNGGHDINSMQMVSDAVSKAVEQGVDFSKYYVDGHVPLVSVLYAGPGEATGGDENTVWPHFRTLTSSYRGIPIYQTMSTYQFGSYFVGNEILEQKYSDGTTVSYLMGMGVFVHEFGHALGLPDFYVTDYSYSNDSPFGDWSVMDTGEYYASAYAPVGYNAYEKSYMGWLDISELTEGQQKTLKPGEAALIRNANNTSEYFILENHQPGKWYPASMGSGLLNMRIAYNSTSWLYDNLNNTQNRKRAMVVTADSVTLNGNANESNLYGNGVTNMYQFTMLNGTVQTTTPVYRIVKHEDGTITLNFIDRAGNNAVKGDQLYYKITDASQLTAGDTIIFVNEKEGMAMGKVGNTNGRIGVDLWIEDGTAYATSEVQPVVYRQGNGFIALQLSGSIYLAQSGTTALRTLPNSRFRTTDDYKASLSFDDGNALLQFQGTGAPYMGFDAYGYDFVCTPEATTTLQVYSRKKPATPTGINVIKTQTTQADAIYTLTGQKVSRSEMRHGVYIVGGRKVVVK